jgi:hypothetical protein
MPETTPAAQPGDSATPDLTPGAEPKIDDPGKVEDPATTPPGDKPAADPGDGKPAAEQDFVEVEGVKYYKSFDKHPEWRGMKDGSDTLNQILEDNGYASQDELISDLNTGVSLASLIGTTDANKVQAILDKAQKWDAAEVHWAEEAARKQEKGETDEETIARLKREKQELQEARRQDKVGQEELDRKATELRTFNSDVSTIVDATEGLTSAEKTVLKLHLGVDNPMDDINIGDRKLVRATAQTAISKFQEFIKGVRQAAIDEYSDGKSDLVPAPTPEGDQTPTVETEKVKVDENTSIEEAFAESNKLLIEQLNASKEV